MRCRSLVVVVALLCGGPIQAAAQEAHPAQAADQGRPTHGIIRKPQPKPAEAAKPTTTQTGKPEPVKATQSASTEAVAAAIANAVRSLEEQDHKRPESVPAQPARAARPAAPRAVAPRRYSVTWPSQRFEVRWAAPDDRVMLSWGATETSSEQTRDNQRLEP
jgi:hypothetical protein